jgi:hypothetical protein
MVDLELLCFVDMAARMPPVVAILFAFDCGCLISRDLKALPPMDPGFRYNPIAM